MEETKFVAADINTTLSGKEVSQQDNANRGPVSQQKWLITLEEQWATENTEDEVTTDVEKL